MSALTQEEVASLVPLLLDQCVFVLVNLCASIWAFHIPTPCLLPHRTRPARPSYCQPQQLRHPSWLPWLLLLDERVTVVPPRLTTCAVCHRQKCAIMAERPVAVRPLRGHSGESNISSDHYVQTAQGFSTNANHGWG